MLTEKQISEIREHLERAQNPLFFFDNDQDGLCSFLLLQRAFERGKGIPIKSFPDLTSTYFRRVRELNADYIFILDKPLISEEFVEEARKINIPIVWIDHHDVYSELIDKTPEGVFYYNPVKNKSKTSEPVAALCYQIANKKDDLWIAFVGCISDAYFPDFYDEFKRDYPELLPDESNRSKDVLEIYFRSQLGKIAQILGAGLKDKTTNVVAMLKFLMRAKGPYDILEETGKNFFMHKRFEAINKRYKKLIEKASANAKSSEEILFFEYGGDLSISSELANGLKHKFPEKVIVVSYITGAKINVSIRGKNIRSVLLKVVERIEGATGGGHEDAVGAKINSGDWNLFKEKFKEEFLRQKKA